MNTSVVRSRLECCSVAWDTSSKRNLAKLEGVQRHVTRHIIGNEIEYPDRLRILDLLPLSFRREILDLNFFHKCLTGNFYVPLYDFVEFYTLARKG
jgi:hypothetical protein